MGQAQKYRYWLGTGTKIQVLAWDRHKNVLVDGTPPPLITTRQKRYKNTTTTKYLYSLPLKR
jgi:hypothetical protein